MSSSAAPVQLLAIVGIDGSGKTTAAKEVVRRLRARGIRARYFENAGLRPPLNWMARRLGRNDAVEWLGVERFQGIEYRVRKAAMWRAVLWARLPGNRVAIMDRYTVCQYAAMRTRGGPGEAVVRLSYAALPWPDAVLFLEVAPADAQRRVTLRGRDTETLHYLTAADMAYRSLPEWSRVVVVDASGSAGDVATKILGFVVEP